MFSVAGAWIAARFRKTGAALVAGAVVVVALLGAFASAKRSSYKKGKRESEDKAEIEKLKAAVEEGKDHAEISNAMHEAHVNGPRNRADVLDRLQNDED